jgi:hypothetical protein
MLPRIGLRSSSAIGEKRSWRVAQNCPSLRDVNKPLPLAEARAVALQAAFVEAARRNEWGWIADGLSPKLKENWVKPMKGKLIAMLSR